MEALETMARGKASLQVQSLDDKYSGLRCKLTALEAGSREHEILGRFLSNTHGATHGLWDLQLQAGAGHHHECCECYEMLSSCPLSFESMTVLGCFVRMACVCCVGRCRRRRPH